MLTITCEGYRLLGFWDFDGNLDWAAVVPSTVSLADDGAEDVAGVGGRVVMRKLRTQAGGKSQRFQSKHSLYTCKHLIWAILSKIVLLITGATLFNDDYSWGWGDVTVFALHLIAIWMNQIAWLNSTAVIVGKHLHSVNYIVVRLWVFSFFNFVACVDQQAGRKDMLGSQRVLVLLSQWKWIPWAPRQPN